MLGETEVGVPEIAQVVGFKTKPEGRAGLILQELILPENVGVIVANAPVVNV